MTEQEISGRKVGRLTGVRFAGMTASRMSIWLWRCDCGREKEILLADVLRGHTLSCGCLRRDTTRTSKLIHGAARRRQHTAEYRSWRGLLTRTGNPSNPAFPYYGGRGISVCLRWVKSFEHFLADMGKKPSPLHSIERVNNDGDYTPSNCVWATPKQQAANRRKRLWKKKP